MTAAPAWSASEMATLAAVAETFVPGGGDARAARAAEALEAGLAAAQVRQLRLVLGVMDSRLANLVLAARAARFRDLAAADRERCLLAWAGSAIPQRRAAFHAYRKLLTFLAYARGSEDAAPRLEAIGYRPDQPPVAPDSAITPWQLPADNGGPVDTDADVIVVGSGAGGGVVARDLAMAGRSVLVLEAGPLVTEAAMPVDELDAFDRLYLDHGLTATWDGSATLLAGAAVGGGTLVNWMTCVGSPAELRAEWVRDHGIGGWDGGEAIADVVALESELGVREAASVPPKDAAILRGAAALGWKAGRIRRNGPDCADCGSCGFGCRRGTKRSAVRSHLAEAVACGARIVPDARVDRIIVRAGRVVGVAASVGDPLRQVMLPARQVVVAAGALRTPAILQRSGAEHPAIGRHLRIHPVSVVAGRFDEPVDMWRGVMQAARVDEFVAAGAGPRPYVIESAPGHPGLLALALPWEGAAAHAALASVARHLAPFIAITRDGGEGRVRATGARHTRVDYRLDSDGIATLRHALGSMARLAGAAGAREILALGMPLRRYEAGGRESVDRWIESLAEVDFRPNRGTVFSAHQLGSVRMGARAGDAPCDPAGRLRTSAAGDGVIRGLYVADGSLAPTGLGVNPMITIMALARRVGRTVIAEA
ncbi:MAG TPA: GMC family oxidoreductase N-terminal domain-containing protein [Candidatus Limnocylindrales bacterium]